MQENIEETEHIIKYWKESAEENYRTMQNLILTKEYAWSLFLGHLVIEKLLKANYVKKLKQHPVFSHDLLRLARKIELEIPNEFEEWLDEITTFNLNTRYDNYKQSFNKLCTPDFSKEWINKINIIRQWLINQL